MNISRVEIDVNNRRKIKDLSHLGAYHHWVEQSFPDEFAENQRSRKLWRVDKVYGKHYLIIISEKQPDIRALEKYGVEGSGQTKSYDNYLNQLKNGDRMRFRIALNPSITLSKGSGNRGITKPHVTMKHQIQYLLDRSQKNGFCLNESECTILERGHEIFRKRDQKAIRWIKVVYEGVLTIDNIDVFRETLMYGFGKHKAYGFGMMTVMPIME